MLNSRDINRLRPDVAANCRKLIARCAAAGLPVLVTGTVRDDEFQLQCFRKGTGGKPPATFHSVKAGLAFDICKNVKDQEYSDAAFFTGVAKIAKEMGFTWGGDWKDFVDKPHFQWDQYGKYHGKDIIAGRMPPSMPLYTEERKEIDEEMTQEQFDKMMDNYLAKMAGGNPSEWSEKARKWAEKNGIIAGDGNGNMKYKAFCTREQMVQFLFNANAASEK